MQPGLSADPFSLGEYPKIPLHPLHSPVLGSAWTVLSRCGPPLMRSLRYCGGRRRGRNKNCVALCRAATWNSAYPESSLDVATFQIRRVIPVPTSTRICNFQIGEQSFACESWPWWFPVSFDLALDLSTQAGVSPADVHRQTLPMQCRSTSHYQFLG